MNGYQNGNDDEYADDGAEYGYEDENAETEEGYGEDEVEAEARRQAEAYHARAANDDHTDGYGAGGNQHDTDDDEADRDERPRESRKERRRREAAERQARAEAEAAMLASRGKEPERQAASHVAEAAEPAVEKTAESNGNSGRVGRWFGKRSGEDRMGENRSGAPQIEIVLPSSDRIDPNALKEFGLDPNTLAAMGMDPATLPQFEPEFLVELGINPQIVVEILRRQKLAEMGAASPAVAHADDAAEEFVEAVAEVSKRKFDMSPAAWIGRYRKVQKWAPAAAAAAGLTTTGSIWFMSGDKPEKPVEQVKNEQLAGETAENALNKAVAKDEEPGIAPEKVADAGQAETQNPQDEKAPTDPAASQTSLAMNDLPALPATPVGSDPAAADAPKDTPADAGETKAADGLPALPLGDKPPGSTGPDAAGSTETPPGLNAPDAPPGLPGLPAEAAPPGLPGNEAPPGLPADSGKPPEVKPDAATISEPMPPAGDAPKAEANSPDGGKAGTAAKALAIPALGGLGAAAAIAASKPDLPPGPEATKPEAAKPADGMPELPKPPDSVPAEAPPGVTAAAADLPLPAAEAAPGLPAPKLTDAPPGSIAPSEPVAPPAGEMLSNTIPKASSGAELAKEAASDVPKAAVAGIAAGVGAGLAAESLKPEKNPADMPELPKPGGESSNPANEPPARSLAETPAERPPGIDAPTEPPNSLAGLPRDIPQTPAAEARPESATPTGKPRDADASGPSIPNSRGKLLRSLASTSSTGSGMARTATAAALGTGAGLALGTAIAGSSPSGGSVQVESTPAFDAAPPDIAPIRHTVQSGENFWTISRDYYGSGRYYKALWAANASRIGKIDELHVGDVVQIPAMENLDKSLIDGSNVAKSRKAGSGEAGEETPEVARSRDARAVRTRNEIESVPIGGEPGSKPARKAVTQPEQANPKEIVSQPIGETASKAGYVRHRVRPGETLRTIAADRLGNSRRANEIVELNADLLDDVRTPIEPDMILMLPRNENDKDE